MSLVVEPLDTANQRLLGNVKPADWKNPTPAEKYNLVAIGAGTAGLVSAAACAALGGKAALIERDLLGGDCLNVGCVPSKALLRSAHFAGEWMKAENLGWRVPGGIRADFEKVMERLREIRASISPHDSVRRFRELGVDVFLGSGRFRDRESIEVGGAVLKFHRAVITTGARAVHPPIPGLAEAGFLTNENVFNLTKLPERLAVIGGGPIGCELSQAFRRLGSEVTLLDAGDRFLPREDEDAAEILKNAFESEGIRLVFSAKIIRVEKEGPAKKIVYQVADKEERVTADEILVGVGRAPNVEGLNLEAAGIAYDPRLGVQVDDFLRTTNSRVFAAGDVCSAFKFTHIADAQARMVVQNALFFGRARVSRLIVPWCTYTDPEIAHVGMYERDARAAGIPVETFKQPFSDVDRAVTDSDVDGFVKVHVKKGTDRILGATIVAAHAGEMISEITAAMVGGLGLAKLSSVIHPYPTQAEAIRKTADAYRRTHLTPRMKKILTWWMALWRR